MEKPSTPAEVGKRIYARRKALGITQEELADFADTTPQAISNYERGERELKAGMLVKIAAVLHISVDFLLTGVQQNGFVLPQTISAEKKRQLYDIFEKCAALLDTPPQT